MPAPRKHPRKKALTVKLPADLCDEVRAVAAREIGRPLFIPSLSALVEQAIRRELARIDAALSSGQQLDRISGSLDREEKPIGDDEPPPEPPAPTRRRLPSINSR